MEHSPDVVGDAGAVPPRIDSNEATAPSYSDDPRRHQLDAWECGRRLAILRFYTLWLQIRTTDDELWRLYSSALQESQQALRTLLPDSALSVIERWRNRISVNSDPEQRHELLITREDDAQAVVVNGDSLARGTAGFHEAITEGVRAIDRETMNLLRESLPSDQRLQSVVLLAQDFWECSFPCHELERCIQFDDSDPWDQTGADVKSDTDSLDDETDAESGVNWSPVAGPRTQNPTPWLFWRWIAPAQMPVSQAHVQTLLNRLDDVRLPFTDAQRAASRQAVRQLLGKRPADAQAEFQQTINILITELQPSPPTGEVREWRRLRVDPVSRTVSWPGREPTLIKERPQFQLLEILLEHDGQCQQEIIAKRLWSKGDVDSYEQLRKVRSSLNSKLRNVFGTTGNRKIRYLVPANPNGGKKTYGPECTLTLRLPTLPESPVSPPPPGQPSSAPNPTEARSG